MPDILKVIAFLIGFWIVCDLFVWMMDVRYNTGELGNCSLPEWKTIGIISYFAKPDKVCSYNPDDKDECKKSLGKWARYKLGNNAENKNSLCKREIDLLYKENIENNVVAGYNAVELLSYVIVPFVTVICIILGIISTLFLLHI